MRNAALIVLFGACACHTELDDMQGDEHAVDGATGAGGAASEMSVGSGGHDNQTNGAGGGQSGWQATCLEACETVYDCTGENMCVTRLGLNCSHDPPPADPTRCALECIANEPMMGCTDLALYFSHEAVPPPPSALAQCLSGCPGPAAISTGPSHTVYQCADVQCHDPTAKCAQDPTCFQWFVDCAEQCSDYTQGQYASAHDCWSACTVLTGANNSVVNEMVACMCDAQAQANPSLTPAWAWFGTVSCSDLIAGFVDACSI